MDGRSLGTPRSPATLDPATLLFEARVVKNFQSLAARNFNANEAAALALKFASGMVPRPMDPRTFVLEAQSGADMRTVLHRLSSMFSSPETVAATFAKKKDHVTSDGVVCIDFEALDAVYYSFTDDDTITATLLSSVARVTEQLVPEAIDDPSGSTPITAALVLLENPSLEENDNHWLLSAIAHAIMQWPDEMLQRLVHVLSTYTASRISTLLHKLQQFVSMYLYQEGTVDSNLEQMVKVVGLLYRANEEGGMLSFTDFYNDSVNQEEFNWKEDYMRWKYPTPGVFSFCTYPYMYDPSCKQRILQLENRKEQEGEFQEAIVRYLLSQGGNASVPYLILKVRRGPTLIADTLDQIQKHAAQDGLKKPLKVQFVGEDGIDEGGVQKEFFQLIFRSLFDPNYGMFVMHETTRQYWFRNSTIDTDLEFQLVGILLGLAIYNNHILQISFPMLVYRKLMGHKPTYEDLREVAPEIHSNLQKLLEYDDASVLEVYFQVDTEGEFGEGARQVDLLPDGGNVLVTNSNREEYVRLYTEHLLEKSIRRQFSAFKRGFLKLCEGPALSLFRPEELELLICGSQRLDFGELESGTQYEGGYFKSHEVIRWFWEVVDSFSIEKKKRLLFFVTGSDRVPIKGLANLSPPFTIARNGPNSRRLPTAHTCFNHLLMPQYKSKSILRERLLTAIENAEGFGLK